jgi:glutaredoxin-like protein NrdH
MSYAEQVEYSKVEGEHADHQLRIYALSTCAFCEKAMDFLKEHNYQFEYLFMDLIDRDLKKNIKTELKEKHGSIPLFPLLVIDGEQAVSGFTEDKWRELLNIG